MIRAVALLAIPSISLPSLADLPFKDGRGLLEAPDQPASPRGEPECCNAAQQPLCDGDANGDGLVDAMDVGFVLARLGDDAIANCAADNNCDGAIDPLDAGYVLARFDTCSPVPTCSQPCTGASDDCTRPKVVTCGGTYSEDIVNFTSVDSDPVSSCETDGTFCPSGGGGPFSKDASWWYKITTGPDTTRLHLDFCDTPNEPTHDVVVSIWDAELPCDALVDETELACDDDFCTCPDFGPPSMCANVEPNTSYLILVDHYSGTGVCNDPGCIYRMDVLCNDGCTP